MPGRRPIRPAVALLAFGTKADDEQPTLVVVQPNDSWHHLGFGADAAEVVAVHREFASTFRVPDLVFVADLTLALTAVTGDRQPWASRRADLDAALDGLRDLADRDVVASQSVRLTLLGFGLACSPCRDLTVHQAGGKETVHRDDHIDDVKTAVLEAWADDVVAGGLRMRGWRAQETPPATLPHPASQQPPAA